MYKSNNHAGTILHHYIAQAYRRTSCRKDRSHEVELCIRTAGEIMLSDMRLDVVECLYEEFIMWCNWYDFMLGRGNLASGYKLKYIQKWDFKKKNKKTTVLCTTLV